VPSRQPHAQQVEHGGDHAEGGNGAELSQDDFAAAGRADQQRLHGAALFLAGAQVDGRIERAGQRHHHKQKREQLRPDAGRLLLGLCQILALCLDGFGEVGGPAQVDEAVLADGTLPGFEDFNHARIGEQRALVGAVAQHDRGDGLAGCEPSFGVVGENDLHLHVAAKHGVGIGHVEDKLQLLGVHRIVKPTQIEAVMLPVDQGGVVGEPIGIDDRDVARLLGKQRRHVHDADAHRRVEEDGEHEDHEQGAAVAQLIAHLAGEDQSYVSPAHGASPHPSERFNQPWLPPPNPGRAR
jgi:hypothetical protein